VCSPIAVAPGAVCEPLAEELGVEVEEAARGVYSTVSANMAGAIREITVRKGIDPRECALIAFGGAGAQHAAEVASTLDRTEVVIPAHASVLSAVGLMTAPLRVISARTLLLPVAGIASPAVAAAYEGLRAGGGQRVGARARAHG